MGLGLRYNRSTMNENISDGFILKDIVIFVYVEAGASLGSKQAYWLVERTVLTPLALAVLYPFADKFTVAVQRGIGELIVQLLQQAGESLLLLWSARVLGRLAILGQASYIADTDAMAVMATRAAVRSLPLDGSADMDRAVKVNQVMVADAVKFPGPMPVVHVLDGDQSTLRRSRAVADDFIDFPHGLPWF